MFTRHFCNDVPPWHGAFEIIMKVNYSSTLLGLVVVTLLGRSCLLCGAFAPRPFWMVAPRTRRTTTTSFLAATTVNTSTPSQAECEALGIREWPQQVKKGSWSETAPPNTELIRYILEGQGTLVVTDDDGNDDTSSFAKQQMTVQPGTLITVSGPARLTWQASTADMIILTPSYEQGGLLVAVGIGLLVLLPALLATIS